MTRSQGQNQKEYIHYRKLQTDLSFLKTGIVLIFFPFMSISWVSWVLMDLCVKISWNRKSIKQMHYHELCLKRPARLYLCRILQRCFCLVQSLPIKKKITTFNMLLTDDPYNLTESVKAERLLEGIGSPLNPALLSIKKRGFCAGSTAFFL